MALAYKIPKRINPKPNPIEFDGIKHANAAQLDCLSNLENLNALFISQGLKQPDRLTRLNAIAIQQMKLLTADDRLPRLPGDSKDKG